MTTERIEAFYRDATAADVARVMNGETVEARFRDDDSKHWNEEEYLGGWVEGRWKKAGLGLWNFCQVYDPPQWYVDKPEPGEGYRLLAKFPVEDLHPLDEAFINGNWQVSSNAKTESRQSKRIWYRRRIEQLKPESKHYTLNVGDTIETPSLLRITVTEHGIEVK